MVKATNTFYELIDKNIKTLDLYTKAISRVHGESLPEAYDVRKLFETIQAKLKETDASFDEEFSQLRQVTNNYQIPEGVCETYASVYKMLAELDQAYEANNKKRI